MPYIPREEAMPTIQPANLPAIANLLLALDPAGTPAGDSGNDQGFAAQFSALLGTLGTAPVVSAGKETAAEPGDLAPPQSNQPLQFQSAPQKPPTLPGGKQLPDRPNLAAEILLSARPASQDMGDLPDADETAALAEVSADSQLTLVIALLAAGATGAVQRSAPEDQTLPAASFAPASIGQRLLAKLTRTLPVAPTPMPPVADGVVTKSPSPIPAAAPAPVPAPVPSSVPAGAIAIPAQVLISPVATGPASPHSSAPAPAAVLLPILPANLAQGEPAAREAAAAQALPVTAPEPKHAMAPVTVSETGQRGQTAADESRPSSTLAPAHAAKTDLTESKPVIVQTDPRLAADTFANASSAQPAALSAVAATPAAPHAPAAHDFAALIDRLVEARQAAQAGMSGQTVLAAVNHAEFGQLSLQFRQDAAGLSVTLASSDPDLARAVQAAAPASQTSSNNDSPAAQRQDASGQAQSQSQSQSQQPQQQRGQSSQSFAAPGQRAGEPDPRRSQPDTPQKRGGIFA